MSAKSLRAKEAKEEKRRQRARNEHMTLTPIGPNSFGVTGDSGETHVIDTEGCEATFCTCPDKEHNLSGDERCKHMLAYEQWEINEVKV